ncbi:MAG: hypothetical protein Q8T08_12405 [Ignavibacteria bacterium]|jgi:hypothetical protein|nr:hypothetical protein [Ignavibacteria bacterium]
MKRTILISLFLLSSILLGQQIKTDTLITKQSIGTELDLLPYISGGYYVSAWYGVDQFRFRAILTKTKVPQFAVANGYTDNKLNVYAFITDYFFMKNFEGFWIGTGLEYWDSQIKFEAENKTTSYNNSVFTLGGGYVWKLYKNFYLNPWVAFHYIIAGDKEVRVGSSTFKPNVFTPEASIKIGLHF